MKMKKLILVAAIGLGIAFTVSSCTDDAGDGCKYCYIRVSDADGNILDEGVSEEYCGSELDGVDGVQTTDGDGNTSEWICDAASKK